MIEFKNRDEYKLYLEKLFNNVSENRSYNVFLHCVTNASKYFCNSLGLYTRDVNCKAKSILENGLDLDGSNAYGRYGSISCTTKRCGESNNVDFEKVLNYDYLSCSENVHTIILLIPKHISVDGEQVEFSSTNKNIKRSSQHDKTCWFDVVKDRFCPTEFTFGYQVFDTKTKSFKFLLNNQHFAFCEEKKQIEIEKYFAKKIEKEIEYCKRKYGVEGLKDILIKKTEEHMVSINDFIMDP